MIRNYILFFIAFICCIQTTAQVREIKGRVYADGKGLKDVVVSSGYQFTKTDKKGNFKLAINEGNKFVQITSPSNYLVEVMSTVPQFYQVIQDSVKRYNFYLTKNKNSESKHTVVVQTDVQVANLDDLAVYKEKVLPDIKRTISQNNAEVLGLDLGDIVGDDPQLFRPYVQAMEELEVPFYRLIGNHDMAYWGRTFETSESHFNKHFGPTTYSFNKGNIHYVVLNNSFYFGRDYFYMGYIDENSFKWLERDLSFVPKGSTVFVMVHIPTQLKVKNDPFVYNYSTMGGTTINSQALYKLLEGYNVHILSGHTHQSHNIEFSETLMEHNIPAASGSWWQLDLCTDGTPRGYRVFEIDNDSVSWYYKSAGFDRDYQSDSYIDENGVLVSNVWNYDSKWKVEWFEDEVLMGEMEQFEGLDKRVLELCKDKSKLKYNWIGPSNTKHLFRTSLKDRNAKIKVRLTDRFNNVYEELVK